MQDNKSYIFLHNNYLFLVSKGIKHINICYFFVIDKIQKKEMKIEYYLTKDIVADYSNKPIQRILFVKQRNII